MVKFNVYMKKSRIFNNFTYNMQGMNTECMKALNHYKPAIPCIISTQVIFVTNNVITLLLSSALKSGAHFFENNKITGVFTMLKLCVSKEPLVY